MLNVLDCVVSAFLGAIAMGFVIGVVQRYRYNKWCRSLEVVDSYTMTMLLDRAKKAGISGVTAGQIDDYLRKVAKREKIGAGPIAEVIFKHPLSDISLAMLSYLKGVNECQGRDCQDASDADT